jgi:YD repeat-containing protein
MRIIRREQIDAFRAAAGKNAPNSVAETLQRAGMAATVDSVARTVTVADNRQFRTTLSIRPDGSLDTLVSPSGYTLRFEPDAAGRLGAVNYPSGARVQLGYDQGGRVSTCDAPNGVRHQIDWDDQERPVSWRIGDGKGHKYEYGADGLLAAFTDRLGGTTRFTRDRLESAVIDPLGRRVVYHTPAGGDWVEKIATPTGRLTSCPGTTRLARSRFDSVME